MTTIHQIRRYALPRIVYTLLISATLTLAHPAPDTDTDTLEGWCQDMIAKGNLTDSVTYICFDNEGNAQY